jgi:DNA ligase (NAD+)
MAGPVPASPADKPVEQMSVEELAVAVRYHNWRYFNQANPEISDQAFDLLTRRLADLAPNHGALVELVADVGSGEKVEHDAPMLSLDKCYDEATLSHWAESFEGDVVETPKVDGVAAALRYDGRGVLVAAITRGDGKVGETFTDNARYIDEIPGRLSQPPAPTGVEVRGELYMRLSVFETLKERFSNPRNTTAGAIKQKDASKTAEYRLSFFVYDVLGVEFETEMDKVAWSQAHGLTPVTTHRRSKAEMQAGYDGWLAARDSVDFEMDGVVYKVDHVAEHRRLGSTAHHPRYAIAYKFQGDAGTSTLLDVQWSTARTGAITPVAIVAPVELSGAVVRRCSLHNLAQLRRLGARIGATVTVVRRGGVIPHIEAVLDEGEHDIVVPSTCQACGAPTRIERDFLYCSEPKQCPVAVQGSLEHFVKSVEIDGFGPKLIANLMQEGLLATPADFYRLTEQQIAGLQRSGETLAGKLVAAIGSRRQLPLAMFLTALGIDGLGPNNASRLAGQYHTLEVVRGLGRDELEQGLTGFGPELTAHLVDGLQDCGGTIEALLEFVEVMPQEVSGGVGPGAFDGRSFVFTGALATMSRNHAQKWVRRHGGMTPGSVSARLDYLVVGDKGSALLGDGKMSTKHKKAARLVEQGAGVEIVTEAHFVELVEQADRQAAQAAEATLAAVVSLDDQAPVAVSGHEPTTSQGNLFDP